MSHIRDYSNPSAKRPEWLLADRLRQIPIEQDSGQRCVWGHALRFFTRTRWLKLGVALNRSTGEAHATLLKLTVRTLMPITLPEYQPFFYDIQKEEAD